jgi:hypothetical protein
MRSRRIAAMAALAVLTVACSNNDADEGDVVDAMTDAGLTDGQAACIGERFVDEFNQDQLNDLASADDPADFPEGTEDQVEAILRDCTGTEGGSASTEDTSEDDSSSDTTAGEDEESSDTTADDSATTETTEG